MIADKLSIGGRAIFGDICKEAMKKVCVLSLKTIIIIYVLVVNFTVSYLMIRILYSQPLEILILNRVHQAVLATAMATYHNLINY